jgi:hypothetical protein
MNTQRWEEHYVSILNFDIIYNWGKGGGRFVSL